MNITNTGIKGVVSGKTKYVSDIHNKGQHVSYIANDKYQICYYHSWLKAYDKNEQLAANGYFEPYTFKRSESVIYSQQVTEFVFDFNFGATAIFFSGSSIDTVSPGSNSYEIGCRSSYGKYEIVLAYNGVVKQVLMENTYNDYTYRVHIEPYYSSLYDGFCWSMSIYAFTSSSNEVVSQRSYLNILNKTDFQNFYIPIFLGGGYTNTNTSASIMYYTK